MLSVALAAALIAAFGSGCLGGGRRAERDHSRYTLYGHTRLADGTPVGGATVHAYRLLEKGRLEHVARTVSNADGFYGFVLKPGRYYFNENKMWFSNTVLTSMEKSGAFPTPTGT